VQVAIGAETRLVIVTGDPQSGSRNDCTVYRDSGIAETLGDRQVMVEATPTSSCRIANARDGSDFPEWKEDLNATYRKVRARVERWFMVRAPDVKKKL
jgi:hypothetical protein